MEDKILFHVNGNLQEINLRAWGQDAHYILADQFIRFATQKLNYKVVAKENEEVHWTNEKPYIIYGGFATILNGGKLIIDAGTKVYCYTGTGIWSYIGGALEINGTKEEPVTIQGHRLNGSYNVDGAGQWDRIWINESHQDSKINYAIIKNGTFGVQANILEDAAISDNKLSISNSIIENNLASNLLFRGYNVQGTNLVLGNAGQGSIFIEAGGTYDFRQITIGNEWGYSQRPNPSLYATNIGTNSQNQTTLNNLDLFVGNSIVYGNNSEEFIYTIKPADGLTTKVLLQNCLLKTEANLVENPDIFLNCIANKSPMFKGVPKEDEEEKYDYYELLPDSPAIGIGDPTIAASVPKDIKGVNREIPNPDLGAYQSQDSPER